MSTKLERRIELFKKSVNYFVLYFGLIEWDVSFGRQKDDECRASCFLDSNGRLCTIVYSQKWIMDKDTFNDEIIKVGFHEAAELYTYFIYNDVKKHSEHNKAQEYCHRIIRMLENKIFEVQKEFFKLEIKRS